MKSSLLPFVVFGAVTACFVGCDESDPVPASPPGVDSGLGGGGQGGEGGSSGSGGTDPHEIPDSGDPGAIMCAEMGSLCHDHDDGSGNLGDQCHDVGHAGDPEACAEIYDECIAFCSTDAGHHEEGDGGDAGHHASSVCEELGHLCHDFDTGDGGLGQQCHDVGHAGDEAACLAIQADCLALCGGDAGHHGESGDAGDGGH